MKVQKIDFLSRNIAAAKNEKDNNSKTPERTVSNYSPFAYRDFNINFTARLFRTPENFYAQPFNQKGMPETMKQYLAEDYEDRKKMPPAQMLKVVFEDINEAKSLEQVKELYPDEPLFANLTTNPSRRSRTGVLAEIDLMKQEDKSLFKNGQDNLGMYLLKKVYQEGKTLKEINTDFEKDISVYYKGVSPIQYETLSAFGIKFPNQSFWKSMTATREEFPYEYKPRKAFERKNVNNIQVSTSPKTETPKAEKKKFDNVKDWEIDKLADALIKGNGSKTETEKQIRKRNVQNKDSQTFVSKYFGEINSVVMEKLHISEDMKDYFENYDDLTKNQREKFESYMKNPHMNDLRSKVMSSTIRLFFDLYGADGNNEDFKELLDYAHNIKSERLKQQQQHDALQELYEKELGIFEENSNTAPVEIEDDDEHDKLANFQKLFDDVKKDYNVNTYDFETEDGKVTIVSNLKEAIGESLSAFHVLLPKAFLNNYVKFVQNSPAASDSYILTTLLNEKEIKLPKDDRLMDKDNAIDVMLGLYQDFSDKNPIDNRAAQQAVTDAFIEMTKSEVTPDLFRLGVFEASELYHSLQPSDKAFMNTKAGFINSRYNEYRKPLTDTDTRKITISIMDLLRRYNPDTTIIKNPSPFKGFDSILGSLKFVVLSKSPQKDRLKTDLAEYIKRYGGSARFLLDKNVPESLKMAKMEQLLCSYAYDMPGVLLTYAALCPEGMEYISRHNAEMYAYLRNEVLMNMPMLMNKI